LRSAHATFAHAVAMLRVLQEAALLVMKHVKES